LIPYLSIDGQISRNGKTIVILIKYLCWITKWFNWYIYV